MKKAGRCWKEVGTWKKRTPQSFCFSSLKAGPSVCMKEKVIQLCPTLCDPMDYTYSPWNSPGQDIGVGSCYPSPGDLCNSGIEPRSPTLQADSLPAKPPGKPKDTGVGSLSLLQGIFSTPGIELGSPAL